MAAREKVFDVAIVGAGAAGLAAAGELTRGGRSVVMLEARDRIGGRIHTIRDPLFPLPVELGAEFVHSRSGEVWKLLCAMNSTAYLADGDHWEYRGRKLAKADDFWEQVGKVFQRLEKLGRRDMSFAEFLQKCCRDRRMREAKEMALAFVEGFDAAPAERISAQSIKAAEAESDETEGSESFRLLDGYGAIMEHLHGAVSREKFLLRLRAIVHAVRWKRGRVELEMQGGTVAVARCAIVTLPIGVLRAGEGSRGAIRFEPDVADKRAAWNQIEMGPVVKVIARFREPFWEKAKFPAAPRGASFKSLTFLHGRKSAFPTWWTYFPVRANVMTAWTGGPAAEKLALRPRTQILDAAMASLAQLTGLRRGHLDRLLQRAHVCDWQADPFARGAYSYITVGGMKAPAKLAEPVERTLFFAGEATASADEGLGGTVDAAIASGKRAAEQVLTSLRR